MLSLCNSILHADRDVRDSNMATFRKGVLEALLFQPELPSNTHLRVNSFQNSKGRSGNGAGVELPGIFLMKASIGALLKIESTTKRRSGDLGGVYS